MPDARWLASYAVACVIGCVVVAAATTDALAAFVGLCLALTGGFVVWCTR